MIIERDYGVYTVITDDGERHVFNCLERMTEFVEGILEEENEEC